MVLKMKDRRWIQLLNQLMKLSLFLKETIIPNHSEVSALDLNHGATEGKEEHREHPTVSLRVLNGSVV